MKERQAGASRSRGALLWLWAALALAQALFASVPRLDIAVSALFHDPARGFWLAGSPGLNLLRDGLRAMIYVLAGSAGGVALLAAARHPRPRAAVRPWAFVAACAALGPGLIVNMGLKDHWGRARPADILEFGGAARFTPAFQISDQCARNCSFSSGEAASISMTMLLLCVLAWPMLPPRGRWGAALGAAAVTGLGGGLRIAMGRHFLSDVVISILISALVVAGLWEAFGMRRFAWTRPADLRADLARIFGPAPPRRQIRAPDRPRGGADRARGGARRDETAPPGPTARS